MERGYKSEHRSLTPKETLRAQSGGSESVLEGVEEEGGMDRYAEAGREGYRRGRGLTALLGM